MSNFIKRTCNSKRECITYVVVFLWIYLGILSIIYDRSLEDLSVFFLSLTGFVGSYIVGESMRKSNDSSIFLKGKNSRRETLSYLIILFWAIIGSYITVTGGNIISASSYFAALTPFVGSYIISDSYVRDVDYDEDSEFDDIDPNDIKQINS